MTTTIADTLQDGGLSADGKATVRFTPPELRDASDSSGIVVRKIVTATMDEETGEFTAELDPGVWDVRIKESGRPGTAPFEGRILVPDTGSTLRLWPLIEAYVPPANATVYGVTLDAASDAAVAEFVSGSGPTADVLNATYATPATVTAALTPKLDKTEAAATYAPASRSVGTFGSVMAALDDQQSASIIVSGDSTGNDTGEWVDLLTQWLAAYKPSQRVQYRVWDDTNQRYPDWTVVQAGTGGERHALFAMASTDTPRSMYCTDSYIPAVTGDIDVRVKVALDDWTPSTIMCLAGRWGGAGSRSWKVGLNSGGTRMTMDWSTDGTAIASAAPPPNMPVITDGSTQWLRWVLDVDNGSGGWTCTVYNSADGVAWTQVGQTVNTTAGVQSLFNPASQDYTIGGRDVGSEYVLGKIFETQIRNGIDGKIVNPQPIESWMQRTTASPGTHMSEFGGAPTLYVINGSRPGADITYLNDTTRMPKMVPPYVNPLVFLSCLHNEGENTGLAEKKRWDDWFTALKARVPSASFVAVTQNPQIAPRDASQIRFQGKRRQEVIVWAARNGVYVIDTYAAFLADSRGLSALLNTDGIHPVSAGSQVWADAVKSAFVARA